MNFWSYFLAPGLLALGALSMRGATGYASPGLQAAGPGGASAQPETVKRADKPGGEQYRQLQLSYENIEVYRRLLLKALVPYVHAAPGSAQAGEKKNLAAIYRDYTVQLGSEQGRVVKATPGDVHAHLGTAPLSVEGAFLPSTGVVITAELPIDLPVAEKKVATETKALSEWERTQRELRGEKIDKADQVQPRRPPDILETVLRSLASNGHHLSGLFPPNEGVTVVLTFRGTQKQQCASCHSATTQALGIIGNSGTLDYFASSQRNGAAQTESSSASAYFTPPINQLLGSATTPGGQVGQSVPKSDKATDSFSNRDGSNNRVLLGDLHLKQGRFEEALAAYSKALEEYQSLLKSFPNWNLDPKGREAIMTLLELQNKIIQCHMALKQEDKVQEGVQRLKRWMGMLERVDVKPGPLPKAEDKNLAPATVSMLPTKVIITASKALLDQAGKGEITFEEFKKKAKVDIIRFEPIGSTW